MSKRCVCGHSAEDHYFIPETVDTEKDEAKVASCNWCSIRGCLCTAET